MLVSHLHANGSTTLDYSMLGYFAAALPVFFMFGSLALFQLSRFRLSEPYLPVSVLVLLLGTMVGGLLDVSLPVLSITNTASVLVLGYGVITRQLLNPLRERATRLELLAQLGRSTTATLELDELLHRTVQLIRKAFRYEGVSILLVEGEFVVLRASTFAEPELGEGRLRLRIGTEGVTGWVAAHGAPVLSPDVSKDSRFVASKDRKTESEVAVPIRLKDKVIGVLDAQSNVREGFTQEDVFTLQTVSDQLAIAIENARLYEAARQELAERERAERVLRESEEKFRNLAEQSPNMIFINSHGRLVYVNRQCEPVTGYTREELYDPEFDILELIAPEHREVVIASYRRHAAGQDVKPYEYALWTKTGKKIHVILTSKLITYDGRTAMLGIATDISTRKRTERFLETLNTASLAMERALSPEQIFEIAGDELKRLGLSAVILLADDERKTLRTVYVSYDTEAKERVERLTGIRIDDLSLSVAEEHALKRVIDARETIYMSDHVPIWSGLPRRLERSMRRGCEILGFSRSVACPLWIESEVFGLLFVESPDLSEEDAPALTAFANQMAAAWRKTRLLQDLQTSLEELEETQAQLLQSQKMEAIGRLAGGVAHDFNNLLTVISGYTDVLLSKVGATESMRKELVEIESAAKRAARLTSQLLNFSRRPVLEPEILDLNQVIEAMEEMLRRLIGEHIELTLAMNASPCRVEADRGQIEQALLNMAVNARDAMPDGGTLVIGTANHVVDPLHSGPDIEASSYVKLSVGDTGHGMDEDTRTKIFEPFYTTKEIGKGTGLGLFMVYGTVKQIGGSIHVESKPFGGTTLTILLPQVPATGDPRSLESDRPERLDGAETILLVEDDAAVRRLTGQVLRNQGYRVLEADRALEAVTINERFSEHIHLLITDMIMPGGMNGRDLVNRLLGSRPDTSILYISGYSETEILPPNHESSRHLLPKPFSPQTLLQEVRRILDSAKTC